MILFKILQEFLLSSFFVFVFILVGLVFIKSKKKTGKVLITLGLLIYYLFSITPVADFILQPLESKYQIVKERELGKADKIVLLMGNRESDVLRASEVIRISNIKDSKIIISGTDALNPSREEGEWVKKYLTERGIPSGILTLEDKSRTTRESAKNIKEMIGDEPFFLVTSAYHMPRSMEVFKKMETNPIPAPTDFKRRERYDILDFFPNAQNLRNSDLALHEYFGIVFYRLAYWSRQKSASHEFLSG